MSDLNDDLLNYDIGEDIDEQVLLAADEDDLLLSDEEIEEQKAVLKNEAEKWVNSKLKTTKHADKLEDVEDKKVDDVVTTSTTSSSEKDAESGSSQQVARAEEFDVSTSGETSARVYATEVPVEEVQQSKNDEVSSTNKELEDQTVSQTPVEPQSTEDNQDMETKEVGDIVHDLPSMSENDGSPDSDPREDPEEERGERTNIKLSVERGEQIDGSPDKSQPGRFPSKRGRGGHPMRGQFAPNRPPVRYPHLNYPQYAHHPNENINPQIATAAGQYAGPYGPMDSQLGGIRQPGHYNPIAPRMEYRPHVPNFRPQAPNDFGMYRGMRPDFMNGAQYNNFGPPGMRPMFRPNGASMPLHMRQRMPMQRPPGIPPPTPGNFNPQQQHLPMVQAGSINPANPSGAGAQMAGGHGVASAMLPRKVLINPNFKGGVEAATSQLMKDTQFIQAISSHVTHLQSDEELLRQQEEFINKNRKHIEKRRYERSPERNRSRERSYSPPRRGDGHRRGDSRERRAGSRGRTRRAGSREFDPRNPPKRRRSGSFERRKGKDRIEEEDEETRAYRLEIEKQKAMREKILRDKEMRRRKAAEGKLNEDKSPDEPPAKLKPIIVTESKIISLKRKQISNDETEKQQSQPTTTTMTTTAVVQKPKPIQRTIPTAKILPESIKKVTDRLTKDPNQLSGSSGSATLAVIKPVVKKIVDKPQLKSSKQSSLLDDDELLEDELLADTPSPPDSPKSLSPLDSFGDSPTQQGQETAAAFLSSSNRRVILKSSKEKSSRSAVESSATSSEQSKKGIFDRLEKRKVMVKNAE